jgi:uncharacterized protein with ATP-grasp and redox domains
VRTYLECLPCFLRQALDAARMATEDEAKREAILRHVLAAASTMPLHETPPAMGARIHRLTRAIAGNGDPYREVKKRSNALALGRVEELRREIQASTDPLETAVRLAIAGNIIDFGPTGSCSESEILAALQDCRRARLDRGALEALRRDSATSRHTLYIGDNAGEIVFDRLLIEQLPSARITYAVRGGPVINDATLADAAESGMTDLVPVIDSGCHVPGTILERCSPAFRDVFHDADLVIAKGQGNYESLGEARKPIAFLFKAKCAVIARDAGCRIGDTIIAIR